MTEKRIDYLARMIVNNEIVGIGRTKSFLRAVACEAREEGIDEIRDAIANDFKSDIDRSFYDCNYINSAIKEIAERLKAEGKR